MSPSKSIPTRLGITIKRLRKARGLSQEQLGSAAGVTGSYVSQIEVGIQRQANVPIIRSLARALGVTSEYIMSEAGMIESLGERQSHQSEALQRKIDELQKALSTFGQVLPNDGQPIRIRSRVPAGWPAIPFGEVVDELVIPGNWQWVKVVGESLAGVGIQHGDNMAVDPEAEPQQGQVVVVEFESDRSITAKRWFPENDHVRLESANSHYPCIIGRGIRVLGVVKAIYRDLRPP
jgi:SOS-response transcriptional repressor LexA